MKLYELRKIIIDSTSNDWHKIDSGPTYRQGWEIWSGADIEGTQIKPVEHHSHAAFRDDLDLTITWGMPRDFDDRELTFPWQEAFPDTSVTAMYADVNWRGALVDREVQLVVDGGRAYLPLGLPKKDPTAEYGYREIVSTWQAGFAAVTHGFTHAYSLSEYMQRAGFEVSDVNPYP